jgi:serine/threonine protein phosphatase 1
MLLAQIADDAAARGRECKVVFLGDLIDRGQHSRSVVARVKALCESGDALCIKGNHEELMLHACTATDSVGVYYWAENGGDETIASYKRANGDKDDWRDAIDRDHVAWMQDLPVMIHDEDRKLVFVHGGIDPKTFPNCTDELRMWTRSEKFFNDKRWPEREELQGLLVVHGHTPTDDFAPDCQPRRINVDTGACFGGPLTSVVLAPGELPRFLHAGP